ncbi:MAG TPA: DNA-processing protein DprA, partial [Dehalococcoidia bacterium]|nr:DNA-processing protein DprA [Dehalococcoidia bacterium]
MTDPDLPYWLALARVPRIGGARMALLERHFGNLHDAWSAPRIELQASGLDDTTIRSLLQVRSRLEPEAELPPIEAAGIQALTWHDEKYPRRLKEIDDRPPVLFVRGTIDDGDEWSVAVVGTRRVSAYGRQMAED